MPRRAPIKDSVPSLRRILVRFWPLVRKQRLLLTFSSMGLVAETLLRLLEPWPLQFVVDYVLVTSSSAGSSRIPAINAMDPMVLLTLCAVALVVIVSLRAVATYVGKVGAALIGNRVLTAVRTELFSHLQRLSLSFHNKRKTGDLVTRVTGDIGRLQEVAVTAALPLVANLLTLVGMLAVMFWMNWRLALMAAVVLPVFVFATRRIGGRIRQVARRQRQRIGEMGATAAEAIGSMKVVQSLSLEKSQEESFVIQNRASLKEGVQGRRLSARLVGIANVLIAASTSVVLWYGARLVLDGALTLGELLVFLAYLKTAFKPVRDLAKYAGRIAKAAASAERILEILDVTPLIRNQPGAIPAPQTVTELRFDNVSFGYEADQTALEHFTLHATSGQVIALVGPSGAGKSTVLNLLLRLYDPRSGSITLNGRDIRQYTIESLRQGIAVVPQQSILFALSVRDNIAHGAPDTSEEQVIAAARLASAHDFIMALPQGYDTMLGERGETISDGERQRVAIARAAVRAAPILLLDEPTTGLDNENSRLVGDALRKLSDGRISFIVAHDLTTIEEVDLIFYLDHGRIVEQGTHAQLMAQGGQYAAMHALQTDPSGPHHIGKPHAVSG